MNVEIGTEAAQFPFWEYFSQNFRYILQCEAIVLNNGFYFYPVCPANLHSFYVLKIYWKNYALKKNLCGIIIVFFSQS